MEIKTTTTVELEVEVTGSPVPYSPPTFDDPGDGGYAEDICVYLVRKVKDKDGNETEIRIDVTEFCDTDPDSALSDDLMNAVEEKCEKDYGDGCDPRLL